MSDTNLEKRIVRKLIRMLADKGWKPTYVDDGSDEQAKVSNEKEAMDLVFNLCDQTTITFEKGLRHPHGVLLVFGNGYDIVSDYNCQDPEFDAVLEAHASYVEGLQS